LTPAPMLHPGFICAPKERSKNIRRGLRNLGVCGRKGS
jgi:hypothetical protein